MGWCTCFPVSRVPEVKCRACLVGAAGSPVVHKARLPLCRGDGGGAEAGSRAAEAHAQAAACAAVPLRVIQGDGGVRARAPGQVVGVCKVGAVAAGPLAILVGLLPVEGPLHGTCM